eukprot:scaffold1615_cov42-Prasinocladus_malaysianus.AAC.1
MAYLLLPCARFPVRSCRLVEMNCRSLASDWLLPTSGQKVGGHRHTLGRPVNSSQSLVSGSAP